ncbi:dipeptide ABC transporter ATP-binding protein [Corynebacterium kroppenstedtii]|nr:dipeptide ABC transporter ATP-binding protein [Corynebacterium kroppenstedtii]QRP10545.1 dipeptide ABC transporter ATP-binding protein [Corynebacterium kroppenstedtii]HJD68411.1 dipeptide ABC transporter ATP-binding protein [Corynebacterium kroppenstedtii]
MAGKNGRLKAVTRANHRVMFMVGAAVVSLVVLVALISLVWTPYGPQEANPASALQPPSWDHWMGTDRYGRDTLSRIMVGSQISLEVSVLAVAIGAGVGVPLGILAAVRGGWLDSFIMRLSDLALAFPALLLAIIAGSVVGVGTSSEMVAIGIAFIPSFARVSRAGTRQVLSQDYILAARSAGMGWLSIATRHIVRGITGLIIVQATVSVALAILAEAGLSFLGLGTPPPQASWGRMLQDSQVFLDSHAELALWPGLAIALTVLGFNLLGDGLRDILDPFSHRAMYDAPATSATHGEAEQGPKSEEASRETALESAADESSSAILQVRDLSLTTPRSADAATNARRLVDSLSFSLEPGARLGLIGESGSGKSLTALAIMGLLSDDVRPSGSIMFAGNEIVGAADSTLSQFRSVRMSMVFQEPMTALNPLMTVGKQIERACRAGTREDKRAGRNRRSSGHSRREREAKVRELLESVGLPERAYYSYPFELSGGQRQRVLIAMAFANDPELLICDEPTTALDVTVQRSILMLINRLVRENNTALLFITHDLAVVANMCDNILVLKDGVPREYGPTERILQHPRDSYTTMLVQNAHVHDIREEHDAQGHDASAEHDARDEASPTPSSTDPLLQVRHVSQVFDQRQNRFGPSSAITAVDDVTLDIHRGERLGIVGESGSGKTTLLKIMAGLTRPTSGDVRVDGRAITNPHDMSRYGQVVFQDPRGSLDPTMTIGDSLAEPLRAQPHPLPRDEQRDRIVTVLEQVGLDPSAIDRFPHHFSGGQRQRISLARALTTHPQILLADEPVSALDVTVRNRVIALLDELAEDYGLTMVFLSHDLNVVRHICDTVAVMKNGRIVEKGTSDQIYRDPQHEYTKELISAARQPVSPT